MKQFNYIISDENGIHARPAGLLVQQAKKYESEIRIECKGKTESLKKIFSVMSLGVKQGDEVKVTIDGADEDQAAEIIESFMKANF